MALLWLPITCTYRKPEAGRVRAHGVRRPLDAARYARNRPRSFPSLSLSPVRRPRAGCALASYTGCPGSSRGRYAGVLWAEVDYVDAVAGVAVRVVGEHHRGGGAGLVDDLRDF